MTPPARPMVSCRTGASARLEAIIREEMTAAIGHLKPRHIVIKPNWVLHETDPKFPIDVLVTDARVIAATVRVAAELFPDAARITIGDCPLQRADWPLLCEQSGLVPAIAELQERFGDRIAFRDLRKEVFTYQHDGQLVPVESRANGDPLGYREVELGGTSHLEEVAGEAERFAIHDYDRRKTRAKHQKGDHRYFVSQSFLDADLFINLPKWKTHSKAGLTAALKNLVGINGDKGYLPHFSRGAPAWGGDEYWNEARWLFWFQNTARDFLRERPWWMYRLVRPFWLAFKQLRARFSRGRGTPQDFYVGGGSWHGNQTIWRMIYDLNMVAQRVDARGVLCPEPQRHYFCIVDGLTCGEGDGPLSPDRRDLDWLVFGSDPFAIDTTLAWFMGYDPARIPILSRRRQFMGSGWGQFDTETLPVAIDGRPGPLASFPINHQFTPPPGWAGHIERPRSAKAPSPAGRPLKVVFCWTEVTGYMAACWQALALRPGIELHILHTSAMFDQPNAFQVDPLIDGLSHEVFAANAPAIDDWLLETVRKRRPDVIVYCGWLYWPYTRLVGAKGLERARVVLGMDSPWRGTLRQRMARFGLARIVRSVDVAVTAGERSREYARRIGLPDRKIRSGYYGFDYPRFSIVADERAAAPGSWPRQFLFVGRYVAQKDLKTLVAAYTLYRASVENPWGLTCCGRGEDAPLLRGIPGLIDRGFTQPDSLPEVFRTHGAFVLASSFEPWGVVLAEAAASGLPLICTSACGASADMVRPYFNGLVTAPGDVAGLARALRWIHDHEVELPLMGRRGRALAEGFSAEAWAERWHNYLLDVMADAPSGGR